MAGNTFGQLFTVTTFGESHGPALGAVVDGCPPGMPLTEADLQADLDRRRPGQSKYTTQRQEPDAVKIMLHVHNNGVGVAGVYTYEVAEMKVRTVEALAQKREYPLMLSIEPEDSGDEG